ncbi:tapasin [Dendropsophus ebraccatus]|uniref:tapasin n=1 Tax=Dendropsophus ebraccatus TaxID=150705 RepID=UPI003831654A
MMPSTIYKLHFILLVHTIVLLAVNAAPESQSLSCWLVEDIPGTETKPRSIQHTPVLIQFTDASGLTHTSPLTADPDTLILYVFDPSGKLSPDFTSCEITHHLPQETSLDWARSLTEEKRSPPSLGKTWYTVAARNEQDGRGVSFVLGPLGDKKDHFSVSLAVYSVSTIHAQLGKPLTIPCGMWRGHQPRFAVEWRHRAMGLGSLLYAYDGWKDKVEEHVPNCHLNFSALHSDGDASLLIENVDTSLEGTLLCTGYLPYLRAQREIQMVVTGKPQVTLQPSPLFARPGEEVTLTCDVSHFHPLEISVDFFVQLSGEPHPTLLSGSSLSAHTHNQDGTYSITAYQYMVASSDLNGARYICKVNHVSAPKGISASRTLKVAGVSAPSLEDIMYLFLTALVLYGTLSYLRRKAISLFGNQPDLKPQKNKSE